MFAFEICEKNAMFLFTRKPYLGIFGYFQKIGLTHTSHHFRSTLWFGLLAKTTTNHKHQKRHSTFVLPGTTLERKLHFFKICKNAIF